MYFLNLLLSLQIKNIWRKLYIDSRIKLYIFIFNEIIFNLILLFFEIYFMKERKQKKLKIK